MLAESLSRTSHPKTRTRRGRCLCQSSGWWRPNGNKSIQAHVFSAQTSAVADLSRDPTIPRSTSNRRRVSRLIQTKYLLHCCRSTLLPAAVSCARPVEESCFRTAGLTILVEAFFSAAGAPLVLANRQRGPGHTWTDLLQTLGTAGQVMLRPRWKRDVEMTPASGLSF